MAKVLVLGAAFVDVLVSVDQLPTSGSDVTAKLDAYQIGGCAVNVYGGLRATKIATDLLVPIGDGQYAQQVINYFNAKQIPQLLNNIPGDNGWDLCLIEPDGERSFITFNGVEQQWAPHWFAQLELATYEYIYLSGYELENEQVATVILDALSNRGDAQVVFDASPRIAYLSAKIKARLLTTGVIVTCNQQELAFLAPGDELSTQCQTIYQQTGCPVVVTLAAAGTFYYTAGDCGLIPATPVKVTNTNGAGDTHRAGLLAGLVDGQPLVTAVKRANQLASLVVQQQASSLLDVE